MSKNNGETELKSFHHFVNTNREILELVKLILFKFYTKIVILLYGVSMESR
jgi:hypothetical protein